MMMGGLATPASSQHLSPTSARSKQESTLVKAKSKSASHLATMAAFSTPTRTRRSHDDDLDTLNTLPDPRTPSPAPLRTTSNEGSDEPHPDLSSEVAMLSTKLINAINHQTNLDDSLQHSRHDLEAARRRIAELEHEVQAHATLVTSGALVQRSQFDVLQQELAESRKQRDIAEKGRKEMEVELENLTSALFEEANTMVAAARKESEAVEKKNAQLRTQLNDTELLLVSQQEQLHDLKSVMEKMSAEQDRDETDTLPRSNTAPSTPAVDSSLKMSHMFDTLPLSPNTPGFSDVAPDQPLRFSHLITPVMRNDVSGYVDFADLLKSCRAAAPSHSRNSSGVSSSFYVASASSSSPNIPGSFSSGAASSPREASFPSSAPQLKDTKFYKRCLVEDIEPALRLDLAPGLSWLARRTVIGAITGGSLVIEPFIPQSRFYGNIYACALCGESRRTEAHVRRHRFRTSEDESAQRYPLCEFCLDRVRATCDFLGFLRMVRDGLWRAGTEEDVKSAWEECIRLREKMFWTRLGGGVVPVSTTRSDSPVSNRGRGSASSVRNRDSESSIPRRSGESDFAQTNALEVPKLGIPRTRNGGSVPTVTGAVAESSQIADRSDTRDFAADQNIEEVVLVSDTSKPEDVDKNHIPLKPQEVDVNTGGTAQRAPDMESIHEPKSPITKGLSSSVDENEGKPTFTDTTPSVGEEMEKPTISETPLPTNETEKAERPTNSETMPSSVNEKSQRPMTPEALPSSVEGNTEEPTTPEALSSSVEEKTEEKTEEPTTPVAIQADVPGSFD